MSELAAWAQIFMDKYVGWTSFEDWVDYTIQELNKHGTESVQLDAEDKQNLMARACLPGGRYMANMKAPHAKRQLTNCFALSVGDSREEWAKLLHDVAMFTMYGGGVGVDYSALRPNGASTSTPGQTAGGPCSLIRAVDAAVLELRSCRRGALWAGLQWDHPDIEEFLQLKSKQNSDRPPLSRTNISVIYNHEWHDIMDEGPAHPKFEQAWKVLCKNIEMAVTFGEPGMHFTGLWKTEKRCTNACVPGDTLVLTRDGYKRIGNLVGKQVEVWNGAEWSEVTPQVTGSNQKLMRVVTTSGHELRCTEYHKFVVFNEGKEKFVPAEELQVGQEVMVYAFATGANTISLIKTVEHLPGVAPAVYCFNEPKRHMGVFNGILTGQCSELRTDSPYDSCNIGGYFPRNFDFYDQDRCDSVARTITKLLLLGTRGSIVVNPQAKAIREQNNRLLIGPGGLAPWFFSQDDSEKAGSCIAYMHHSIRHYADHYSDLLGMARPVDVTGIAPHGTIALVAGVDTGGIELPYAPAYIRKIRSSSGMLERPKMTVIVDPTFERVLKETGKQMPTAQDISLERRLEWQAFCQSFTDMGISSTINIPARGTPGNERPIEEIAELVLFYHRSIAGLTFYPDGAIEGQPLTAISYEEAKPFIGKGIITDNEDLVALTRFACKSGVCGE